MNSNLRPPFATPADFVNALHPKDDRSAEWFIFFKDNLLITNMHAMPQKLCVSAERTVYLGTLAERHLFAAEVKNEDQIPLGHVWQPLRRLYGIIDEAHYAMAGRALQLLAWDRTHKYCGCCGKETIVRQSERCRECTACGHLGYPKLAPVVMALVKKEDKILLANSPHFPDGFYSALAGFVDPGETLEQGVTREIFEEVGIKVNNICYFGSQPWPFSGSLMVGFTCEWQEGEIKIDPLELAHADWFDPEHLPKLPPLLSLSRILIDAHCSSLKQCK